VFRNVHIAVYCWSGNNLTINDIIGRFLSHSRTQNGAIINCAVAGIILAPIYFGSPEKPQTIDDLYQPNGQTIAIFWIIATLLTTAYNLYRKPFRTPEIRVLNCHFCGAKMETKKLKCSKCQSESERADS
jgi:hypothetical protein